MEKLVFSAKVEDNIIWVLVVGKFRPIREYRVKGKLPSDKIQKEVLRSVWINCGKSFDLESASLKFQPREEA